MMTCGLSFMKYVLFIFNLVFALSGLGIIIAGALVLADVHDFSYFLEDRIIVPPIVLIVAGAIVFLVAFLGCCGAIKESYKMLVAFAVLLLIIFIVELAVGITASVAKDKFSGAMETQMKKVMINYNRSEYDKRAWNSMQRKLQCCGINAATDWEGIFPPNTIPIGCCIRPPAQAHETACYNDDDPRAVYKSGCYEKLKLKVEEGAIIIIAVGLGVALVELIGIIFAFCLASAIKREKEEEEDGGGGGEEEAAAE